MGGIVSSVLSRQVASNDPIKKYESSAPQPRGQMGGRSCEWLKPGADIEELSGKLSHLNMQEKASLKDLGKAALLTKEKLDNGPGLLTRLCVWMEVKFGDFFPGLKGFKADLDRSIAEDQKELAQFDNQFKQYERMNELRGMTPREIEGLRLSAEEQNIIKALIAPSEKEGEVSLNEFLEGMREGRSVSEPLLLGNRIDQVEALLVKHERRLELEEEVGGILNQIRPHRAETDDKIEYLSYDMLAKGYAANKADALEALESLLRKSLSGSASQFNEDELRQVLVASASNKEDELLLSKLMIDIRHRVTSGQASEYKGAGGDPLVDFVNKPLREAVDRTPPEDLASWRDPGLWNNKGLWDINSADFLSVTSDPRQCLENATTAATDGRILMPHWLFLASDAVGESDYAEAAKKFDGGKALVNQTGSRWFEKHEASLMRFTSAYLPEVTNPPSDDDHNEWGDGLKEDLGKELSSLTRGLANIAGSVTLPPSIIQP